MKRVAWLLVIALPTECGNPSETYVEHGKDMYGRMCAVCHGSNGEGYVADRAPAIANDDYLACASDTFLEGAIERGRPGTTMSAWGSSRRGPLPPTDVRAIVSFMRTWQKSPNAILDERPLSGDATRGQAIWAKECAYCHGEKGTNGLYVNVANAELLASATNGFLRHAIGVGRRRTPMDGYESKIGKQGIDDVIALLRYWQPALGDGGAPPPPSLGPIVQHPNGPEPEGFNAYPQYTPADVIDRELVKGARFGFLDARAPSDYVNEHVAGAVSVPFYDPDPWFTQLPKDAWLVCYCACPHAESGALAEKLQSQGFSKVAILDEGFFVWKSRGYPTKTGPWP